MKITNEQAEYLLTIPKKILEDEVLLEKKTIDQQFPFSARFELLSETDVEFCFLWVINQSTKNRFHISLHYQENDSKIGLLRIDFNHGHENPKSISEHVPEKFRPYVGKIFNYDEHHIHYHVQGYRSLVWAIPLTIDKFEIKELDNGADLNATFANIIKLFAKTVNIKTEIFVNELLV